MIGKWISSDILNSKSLNIFSAPAFFSEKHKYGIDKFYTE